MPKEVSGHCNGKVKPIPKADTQNVRKNSYSLAPVSRLLLTTVSKITRSIRLKSRLGIGQYATKNPDRSGVFYTNV